MMDKTCETKEKCEKKYYVCSVCGNIVEKIHDSGNELVCCGRTMMELKANDTDGKIEFHIPQCETEDCRLVVKVGEEPHPMTKDHYIQWIEIITNRGIQRKCLCPEDEPEAIFKLCKGEKVYEVYAFCNLHKLWVNKCE